MSGRWVCRPRLERLAAYLALHPLREVHYDNAKVAWRYVYARNYALRALLAGHQVAEIVAAYRRGMLASHADAVDRLETVPREPSAAVAYAHRRLRADGVDPAARWAAFFRSDPAAAGGRLRAVGAFRAQRFAARNSPPQPIAQPALPTGFAKQPAGVNPPGARDSTKCGVELVVTVEEMAGFLAGRGLTVRDWISMPWAAARQYVEAARRARPA